MGATKALDQSNWLDDRGNPGGGYVRGEGCVIEWRSPADQAGVLFEDLLAAMIERLNFTNAGIYRCREFSLAVTRLEECRHWLKAAAEARTARDRSPPAAARPFPREV
jgi:hypothetical protein